MSLTDRRAHEPVILPEPPGVQDPVVAVKPPTTRRRPLLLLGGLMVVLSALVAAWLVASASQTHRVLVAQTELRPGVPVAEGDVAVVEVGSALDVATIPANQQDLAVGQYPLTVVPAGTLLQGAMFVPADQVVPPGKAVVGAVLEPGQIPVNVQVGSVVELISTVETEDGTPAQTIGLGEIFAISETDNEHVVSLLVDRELQLGVAAAAAEGALWIGVLG